MTLYFQYRKTQNSSEFYQPIVHLIKNSGIESIKSLIRTPQLNQANATEKDEISRSRLGGNKTLSSGFLVKYCGSVHVGTKGDIKQIEKAILRLIKSVEMRQVPVRFECLEIGIKVTQEADDKVNL